MLIKSPRVFVCAPTYCEASKVEDWLNSMLNVTYKDIELFIVNANIGDGASKIISQKRNLFDCEIHEIPGCANEFWSATVNRGLKEILKVAEVDDWILLTNIDIKFEVDIVDLFVKDALLLGDCQIGALGTSKDRSISSGVQVKSWLMTQNCHPFAGFSKDSVSNNLHVPVDYLPTRCIFFPVQAVKTIGLISDNLLPHYSADYEFSRRLSRSNYPAYISTNIRIEADVENTGGSSYGSKTTFLKRFKGLMSIKNPSNPWYRIVFVILVYPTYAIPTAILLYLIRTFLETLLGGNMIQRILGDKEYGFSK